MSKKKVDHTAKVFYLLTILYMAMIFYTSNIPSIEQPGLLDDVPSIDKLEHFTEFFVLGSLMFLSFHYTRNEWTHRHSWMLALTGAILYAITDETHQMFVPGRDPHLIDLLADTAGITVSCLIGAWGSGWGSDVLDPTGGHLKAKVTDSEE